MTNKEAIETLQANYPDPCFGLLREAVDTAIYALAASTKRQYVIKMNKSTENDIIEKFKRFGEVPAVLAPANWEISRVCEICGRGTGEIDKHICNECRERLQKILYRS